MDTIPCNQGQAVGFRSHLLSHMAVGYINLFSQLHSLLTLYFALVIFKFEYACVAWNAGASKLGCIRRKFLALSYNSFFSHIRYGCANALEDRNFHILCTRRHHRWASFVDVFNVFKCFLFLLENVVIRFPTSKLRELSFICSWFMK